MHRITGVVARVAPFLQVAAVLAALAAVAAVGGAPYPTCC